MIEARYYKKLEDDVVRCCLCMHLCRITTGKRGICGVRENRDGTLYTLVYGKLISESIDPIEKKPLFHFQPGSKSLSIATVGCNLGCLHCQNYEISQIPGKNKEIPGREVSPSDIVNAALQYRCKSISYTYTEPTIFMEYAYDTAVIAAQKGLKNILVTNGYMTGEVLEETHPYFNAANVDLKSMKDEHYRGVCDASLEPVLESIRVMKGLGIWLEVTTLLIPAENDSEEELRGIARFIQGIDPNIPWHISAFHPTYRMTNLPRTPASTISMAREIGLEEGLRFVYTGNLPGDQGENTYCYNCKRPLIKRYGFYIREQHLKGSSCPYCNTLIEGVEMGE